MDFRSFLQDPSRITAEDVQSLRREVFSDMFVSLHEAESVFRLNDMIDETCREWEHFFIEAMTDFCVNQANPKGYVSQTNADWLIRMVSHDGHLKTNTELELLIKIMERAHGVPSSLAAFALQEVSQAVLEGNGQLVCDSALRPGVIGQPEAQLIRRIIHASGADGRIRVSREEAEILFDLNDRTVEVENHPEWSDVFVRAVAAYLMSLGGYQALPPEEVMRREEWLNDTNTDVFGMLGKTFGSLSSIFSDNRLEKAAQSTQNAVEAAWRERNRLNEMADISAQPVTAAEAAWLIERIKRDGLVHENEKALINFLKEESTMIDDSLQELISRIP